VTETFLLHFSWTTRIDAAKSNLARRDTVVCMSGDNPDSNADKNASDLGRFKSPDTKARALANLKPPIQPGSSGLPGAGRPKRDAELHSELLRALNAKVPGDRERRQYKRKIVEALIRKAARGNVAAIHEVLDRTLGRVRWFDEPDRPSTIILQINRNQARDGAVEQNTLHNYIEGGRA
jgi:hypothetical protein